MEFTSFFSIESTTNLYRLCRRAITATQPFFAFGNLITSRGVPEELDFDFSFLKWARLRLSFESSSAFFCSFPLLLVDLGFARVVNFFLNSDVCVSRPSLFYTITIVFPNISFSSGYRESCSLFHLSLVADFLTELMFFFACAGFYQPLLLFVP